MNRLARLTRANRDDLREMQLKAGRVAEQFADTAEHRRMHHQLAAFWRARDESTGPACATAAEIVGPKLRRVGVWTQLFGDLVHHFGAHDTIDDNDSIVAEYCADFVSRSRRG